MADPMDALPRPSDLAYSPEPRSRGGQFERPELTSPWQKFTANWAVRITAGTLLVGTTAVLFTIAITQTHS